MSFLGNIFSANRFSKFFHQADEKIHQREEQVAKNSQGLSEIELQHGRYQQRQDSFGNYAGVSTIGMNFDQVYGSKASRIYKYREMSFWPEIDDAIALICDDAIVEDSSGDIVKLEITEELPSHIEEQIREKWDYLLKDVFSFNNRAWDLFRKWLIDAELYIELVLNTEGTQIIGIKVLPAHTMIPIYKNDRIISFSQVNVASSNNNSSTGVDVGSGQENEKNTVSFDKDQIVYLNYGTIGESNLDPRGYLEPAVRPYNQIRSLTDSLVIARLVRAPLRRVWNIFTGRMPKGAAESYIQGMIQRYRKKLIYDSESGTVNSTQNVQSMMEDFWFAKNEDGKGTEVNNLDGQGNLGDLDDIKMFFKMLYKALKVPKSRWDDTTASTYSSGKSEEILREEIQFSNFVERLVRRFSYILMGPLLTELKLSGLDDKYVTEDIYKIKFNQANLFKEYRKMEIVTDKLNLLSTSEAFIWSKDNEKGIFAKEFVLKRIINFSDNDLDENENMLAREKGQVQSKDLESTEKPAGDIGSMTGEFPSVGGGEGETTAAAPETFVPMSAGEETTTATPEANTSTGELTTNVQAAPESKQFNVSKVNNPSGLWSMWSTLDKSIMNKYANDRGLINRDKNIT